MARDPWTPSERAVLRELRTPADIQSFLDAIPYSADPFYRCPRRVLADRRAHCFDGAVLAAAALERLGHRPLLIDLRAVRDDDHILAVFRSDAGLGAIGKSNFVGLRYREPIHRTLRELVLTYFEAYYNVDGEKTLRSYSRLVDLDRPETPGWRLDDAAMETIAARLDAAPHYPLLTPAAECGLGRMDDRSYRAGMLGVNEAGLYRPGKA
jgi:hypothetical protein